MTQTTRNILITCGVIAFLAAMLVVLCSVSIFVYVFFSDSTSSTLTSAIEILEGVPDDNIESDLPQEVREEMALIEEQIKELRQLLPEGDVLRILYSPEQLRQRVIDDFFGDYTPEEAAVDATVLALFGLLEPDTDLLDLYIELYSEGIAGFYDDETGEMVVVQGAGFGGPEHLTYAHEYVHVLQDQTYDFDDGLGYNDENCEADSEFCAALQALIEGDATFTQFSWYFEYASEEQINEVQEFYEDNESAAFDASPAYLQQDLIFPYSYGQEFIAYLYDQNGWISVDNAYNSPPVSTEQILHPERYPDDVPIQVTLPDLSAVLGAEWELIDEDTLGEWYTFLMLAHGSDPATRLNEDQAQNASEGWGGDAYLVYQNSQTQGLVLVHQNVWDTALDGDEFVTAFKEYGLARYGSPASQQFDQITWITPDGYHVLYFGSGQTTWIFAPDAETAAAIWDALQN